MHALKLLPTVYIAAATTATPPPTSAPTQNIPTPPRANTTSTAGTAQQTGPRPR